MTKPLLHTISVLVTNKPGVLVRIALVFARRGYNIDSLVVSPTVNPKFSRMTIKTKASPAVKSFVTKNASKYNVRIDDSSDGTYIIEQTGTTTELDEFEALLKKYGIIEMIRTGKVLITRGREET